MSIKEIPSDIACSEYQLEKTMKVLEKYPVRGDFTPQSFYQHNILHKFRKSVDKSKDFEESIGRPYYLAIHILSDILYWYRPKISKVRDKKVLETKFRGGMLQKSIGAFARQYHESDRSISAALKFLAERGLVFKKLNDFPNRNTLYLAPNVAKIIELGLLDEVKIEHSAGQSLQVEPVAQAPQEKHQYVYPAVHVDKPSSVGYHITWGDVVHNFVPRGTKLGTTLYKVKSNKSKKETLKLGSSKHDSGSCASAKQTNSPTGEVGCFEKLRLDASANKEIAQIRVHDKPESGRDAYVRDNAIGSTLTPWQQTQLGKRFDELCQHMGDKLSSPKQLLAEIQFCLLDVNALSQCEQVFHRKLACIFKLIKTDRWRTPVGFSKFKQNNTNPSFTQRVSKTIKHQRLSQNLEFKSDSAHTKLAACAAEHKDILNQIRALSVDIEGDKTVLQRFTESPQYESIQKSIETKNLQRHQTIKALKAQLNFGTSTHKDDTGQRWQVPPNAVQNPTVSSDSAVTNFNTRGI